jgi:anti-sigma-K factor RskA
MAEPLSCARAEELLALAAVGAVDRGDSAELDRHLEGCHDCHIVARQNAAVVSLLPVALEPVRPPERLRRAIMARVYAEAAGAPVSRSALRRLLDRIPASRPLTALGAAAAAALVGLVVWMNTGGRTPAVAPVERFTVAGTTAQPAASGTLVYDPSRAQAVLTVRGLAAPPGPPGAVYEVWLVPASGPPVAAAFITEQPANGTWTAVINGPVTGYRMLAATVEPAGGSPGPTGTEVFSADLSQS